MSNLYTPDTLAERPAFYTPATLAEEWGCAPRRILDLVNTGELQAVWIGPRLPRITPAEVDRYIETHRATEFRKAEARSVIYFIACGEFVKIGQAIDVAKRVAALEIGNPYPIRLLATEPGYLPRETDLHRRFRHLHHRGEWFRYEGDLVEYIAERAK